MALEINRAPVLTGKAARDFWKQVEQSEEGMSAQEVRAETAKWREFMSKQKCFQL
ncbi:hypothetical protein FACS189434_03760 [Bacteroidia bacterium]|nr:hypothetical protein FACS189434_03760 [Bacteroidia bacterium]